MASQELVSSGLKKKIFRHFGSKFEKPVDLNVPQASANSAFSGSRKMNYQPKPMLRSITMAAKNHKTKILSVKPETPTVIADESNNLSLMEKDICSFAKDIPQLQVPNTIFDGEDFPVFVTQVHTPFRFWFQLNVPEVHDCLSKMHHFYMDLKDDKYAVNKSMVVIGRACVAFYLGVWHRAEIISHLDEKNESCKVFFFDFGTVDYIYIEDLRLLKLDFATVAKQALRGRLAFLTPKDNADHWNFNIYCDATHEFSIICYNKVVQAILYAFEETESIFHLVLVDTNELEPLNINKVIANRGLAEYLKVKKDVFPHPDELIPTFDMLEKGEFLHYAALLDESYQKYYEEFTSNLSLETLKLEKNRRIIKRVPKPVETIPADEDSLPPYSVANPSSYDEMSEADEMSDTFDPPQNSNKLRGRRSGRWLSVLDLQKALKEPQHSQPMVSNRALVLEKLGIRKMQKNESFNSLEQALAGLSADSSSETGQHTSCQSKKITNRQGNIFDSQKNSVYHVLKKLQQQK